MLFFCETSSLKGASKCVLFFTDIGCGEMAGWGGGGSIQHYHYSPFLLSCSSPPSNYISVFVQHCQVEAFRAIKRNVSEHLVCRYGNFYGRSAWSFGSKVANSGRRPAVKAAATGTNKNVKIQISQGDGEKRPCKGTGTTTRNLGKIYLCQLCSRPASILSQTSSREYQQMSTSSPPTPNLQIW